MISSPQASLQWERKCDGFLLKKKGLYQPDSHTRVAIWTVKYHPKYTTNSTAEASYFFYLFIYFNSLDYVGWRMIAPRNRNRKEGLTSSVHCALSSMFHRY